MNVVLILLGFTTLFVLIEAVHRKSSLRAETTRTTAHVASAFAAAALPWVVSYNDIAIASAIFVPVLAFSKTQNLFSAVHGVGRQTNGEIYFPIAVCLLAILFPKPLPYVYGLLMMGAADAAANMVGSRYGRTRFTFGGGSKSYLGTATFTIVTLIIGAALFMLLAGKTLPDALALGLLIAVPLAAIEALLGDGADNLAVPLVGAALVTLLV